MKIRFRRGDMNHSMPLGRAVESPHSTTVLAADCEETVAY